MAGSLHCPCERLRVHAEPQNVQDRIKKGDKLWMMGFGTGMHSLTMARRHGMVTSCLQQQQCTTSKLLQAIVPAPNQLCSWTMHGHTQIRTPQSS